MNHVSSTFRYAAASVVVAVAGVAFAATAPISDMPANSGAASPTSPTTYGYTHGTNRAVNDQNRDANVLAGQDFQDEHHNALDPNDKSKPAKTKKAKRLAKADNTVKATPESAKSGE